MSQKKLPNGLWCICSLLSNLFWDTRYKCQTARRSYSRSRKFNLMSNLNFKSKLCRNILKNFRVSLVDNIYILRGYKIFWCLIVKQFFIRSELWFSNCALTFPPSSYLCHPCWTIDTFHQNVIGVCYTIVMLRKRLSPYFGLTIVVNNELHLGFSQEISTWDTRLCICH